MNEKIEVTVFVLKFCPFCKRAKKYIKEILTDPKYDKIAINYIDEKKEKELANQFDYYLVPSFYHQQLKLFEGAITKEQVVEVFDQLLAG